MKMLKLYIEASIWQRLPEEMPNKNRLYVKFSVIDDAIFKVSDEDKH